MTLPREINEIIARLNALQNEKNHQETVRKNRERDMHEAEEKIRKINETYHCLREELKLALQDEP